MCKHVAAVLYGVGSRLDYRPELLFVLRGVDAEELIAADITLPTGAAVAPAETLAESGLAEIFNIDMDTDLDGIPPGKTSMKPHPASGSRSKKEKRKSKASQIQPLAPGGKKSKKTSTSRKSKPVFDPTHPTGEGIARLRKLTGFSVETFAKALGVSPPSVQRWENIPGPLRLYARPLAALTRLLEENTSK